MKYLQATLATLSFLVIVELIGCWILLFPTDMANELFLYSHRLISAIITIAFLILFLRLVKKPNLLTFHRSKVQYYLLAVIGGIGFVFFQSLLNFIYFQELVFEPNFSLDSLTSLNVLSLVFITPLIEELFFRNYLLRGLLETYSPTPAIVASSILFAFVHLPFASLLFAFADFSFHSAYIALFGGVISGILFYKSKSVVPSILFHVFWNLTVQVI